MLVDVEGLEVSFGSRTVVSGVGLRIAPGEVVALVGESGSGKSVTARSLVGLAGPRARVRAERLRVDGRDLAGPGAGGLGERELRRLRGGVVGLIAQDPFGSLDPVRPVGREIDDALRLHTGLTPAARRRRVLELLDRVGVPDPERRAAQLPHELSGGLRQRALIAAAIAAGPRLLVADEPTTALDATLQAGILDLVAGFARDGAGVLLISHDLAVVARLADQVHVMRAGTIVETGTPAELVAGARHPYTRALLAAVPTDRPRHERLSIASADRPQAGPGAGAGSATEGVAGPPASLAASSAGDEPAVLSGAGIRVSYPLPRGERLLALDDVAVALRPGRTLGVVGESGSGKSTLARVALGLLAPDAGEVSLDGEPWNPARESARRTRRRLVGAIPQDPLGSLDPRWTVGRTLDDALGGGGGLGGGLGGGRGPRRTAVLALLDSVGLGPELAERRPRHLSSGQRQRVAIARAVARPPRILIADEPVSSLDVSVQAQVLDLLDELQRELGLAILFVSHDLGVVRHMSDEVLVLRDGRVVETGPTERVFLAPEAEYTRELVAAAPRLPG